MSNRKVASAVRIFCINADRIESLRARRSGVEFDLIIRFIDANQFLKGPFTYLRANWFTQGGIERFRVCLNKLVERLRAHLHNSRVAVFHTAKEICISRARIIILENRNICF